MTKEADNAIIYAMYPISGLCGTPGCWPSNALPIVTAA